MINKNIVLDDYYVKTDDSGFIMSLKVDYAFKLVFGSEKHKNVLKGFLSAVLRKPKEYFEDIKLINTELLKEFAEDKKGILDIRAQTKERTQIDIEIQIMPTKYMTNRTLFYWSKMYLGQIKQGMKYTELKKCITINILDFEHVPLEKIHTVSHITEDETNYRMSDMLEIHYLELPKLEKEECIMNTDKEILDWLYFINSNSEEGMKMLAEKNKDINEAYDAIKVASMSKEAKMAYEARIAEIMDSKTREYEAREAGKAEGREEGIELTKKVFKLNVAGYSLEKIADECNISVAKVKEILE